MSVTAIQLQTKVDGAARQEARAWVKSLVTVQGAQYTTIADQISYSRAALMRFVNQDHGSDEIAGRLMELKESWAQGEAAKEAAASVPAGRLLQKMDASIPYIVTDDVRRVTAVCEFCLGEPAIGVVLGPAGGGKTTVLRNWCDQHPEAIYVSADVTMTTRGILEEIADKLSLSTRGTLRDILRRLIASLSQARRVVVVDEADVLVSYSDETVRKIEVLRPLHDRAGASLVLAGLPRLKAMLTRGPSLKQDLAQIYSRVRIMAELRGLTRSEATGLLSGYPMSDAAREQLLSMAVNHAQGGMRRLTTLLAKCIQMANMEGSQITRDIVQAADGLALI